MAELCDLCECSEEGFADMTFQIVKEEEKLFSGFCIECYADYNDKRVGFAVRIKRNMTAFQLKTCRSYKNGICLISTGEPSDSFLNVMAELYETESGSMSVKSSIGIECIPLTGNPRNLLNEPVQFKCFLNTDNEDKYAEFYLNTDVTNSRVYLREKDPEYRENIVNSFKQQA